RRPHPRGARRGGLPHGPAGTHGFARPRVKQYVLTLFALLATSGAALPMENTMQNPLIQKWTGPYGGVPPFDKVKVEQLKPALEAGMAETLAERDQIANDSAPPTFANTIEAMERSGRALDRASTIYGVYSSTMRDPAFQEVEREMEPKLAAFRDQVVQNEKLFSRIADVYDAREKAGLDAEQKRLVWLKYQDFARSGAKLDATAKKKLSDINQRLATLYTEFSQNVLADENTALFLDSESDLAG